VDIAIQGRNIEVSDTLRSSVEQKIARLSRFVDGMERAEVRFSEERNHRIPAREVCEVTVHGRGHVVRAHAAASDTFAAVDRVVDKLEHQMIKLKGKLVGRSQPRRQAPPSLERAIDFSDEAEGGEAGEPGEAKIVKTKRFAIKPMTPEEAALQLDLLGHGFYFFTNSETDRAAVVYRRHDGHIGLIDAT
jgi:putative sigma-54 modulation protein